MKNLVALSLFLTSIAVAQRGPAQPRTLDIYWIDAEGGAASGFFTTVASR